MILATIKWPGGSASYDSATCVWSGDYFVDRLNFEFNPKLDYGPAAGMFGPYAQDVAKKAAAALRGELTLPELPHDMTHGVDDRVY